MEKESLEIPWSTKDTIKNLEECKISVQNMLRKLNMDGRGEQDAIEVAYDYDRAIEALKKQIPVRPKEIEEEQGFFSCGSCGEFITWMGDVQDHQYCLHCGQKLDWSEDKPDKDVIHQMDQEEREQFFREE